MPVYKCRREVSFPSGLCFQRAISFSTGKLRTQGPKFAVSKNALVVSGERFRFRVVCVFNGTHMGGRDPPEATGIALGDGGVDDTRGD